MSLSKVFLDNASTTPLHPKVKEAILPYLDGVFGNPSSIHAYGREARASIEKARKTIANILKTSPSQIFFTSGGTEADNMAIVGCVEQYNIKHIISSPIEHHAVLHTVEDLAKKNIIQLHFVNILPDGSVDLAHLEKLVKQYSNQSLVTLMHANNEIGNMLDLETVSLLCEENGAYFHTDTVQTIGLYPFDLKKLKVDFLVASAHKFHGLKGTGFIYIGDGIRITPFIKGGAQERNMRGGTENTIGIIACAKALELAHSDQEQKRDYIKSLKKYFIDKLKQTVPEAIFNGTSGDIENSLLTVVNVLFPKTKISEMLLFNFDIHGVAVSGGSACTSGTNIGSHVLSTLYGEQDERPAIRFSFSQYNTFAELDYTIDVMNKLFNK